MGKDLPQAGAAHLLQETADLRLENNHQSHNAPFHHPAQQEINGVKLKQAGGPQGHNEHQNALCHRPGAGAADEHNKLVDDKRHDQDVDDIEDPDGGYHPFELLQQI